MLLNLVRTDVSEELSASIIRVSRIGELGTMLAVTNNRHTLRSVRRLLVTANIVPSSPILVILMMETLSSSVTSVITSAARRNIQEDSILHSYRRENFKSYIVIVDRKNSLWAETRLGSDFTLASCFV
jgi:hypothetical protein